MVKFILILMLVGCGGLSEHVSFIESERQPLHKAPVPQELWDFWGTEIQEDRIYWVGDEERIRLACGGIVCGCANDGGIAIHEDCNFCETFAHELGHLAAKTFLGVWDYGHDMWGKYYADKIFEVCND